MAHAYRILFDGQPAEEAVYRAVVSLDVEESIELPGAIELSLAVTTDGAGDYTFINDDSFKPYAALAVEVELEEGDTECIFEGVVLSHSFRADRGTTSAVLKVRGQDSSFLMSLEDKIKEWVDVTDGQAANAIFGDYGFSTASDNTSDDSPSHAETGHTLMQRSSDYRFLRRLARRSGKLCRVVSGKTVGDLTGYFARPKLDESPAATFSLNDPERTVLGSLEFSWDVARPTEVMAHQAVFSDPSDTGVDGGAADSGLALLGDRGLSGFAEKPMKALLTATVDDAGELALRSQALLGEASFFVRCEGEVDLAVANVVLRAGTVIQIDGAGSAYSGKYLVSSVRHRMSPEAHTMRFVLVRNALGPKATGGA